MAIFTWSQEVSNQLKKNKCQNDDDSPYSFIDYFMSISQKKAVKERKKLCLQKQN